MTDPTGRCFLSYKRDRADEVELLVSALHDVGVPTWQDLTDLRDTHIEEDLERVLGSPETGGALLWITPEVASSGFIREVEAPRLLTRADGDEGFYCIAVAAGGLDWRGAAEVLGPSVALHELNERLIRSTPEEKLTPEGAATVAGWILRARLAAVHRSLVPEEPLRVVLYTRARAPFEVGTALALDWQPRFEGREAHHGAWDAFLLPALDEIRQAVGTAAPGRAIEVRGQCAIPAAVALGCCFVAPSGLKLLWQQSSDGRPDQLWSLDAPPQNTQFEARTRPKKTEGSDFALVVSVAADASIAFNQFKDRLPLRAVTEVCVPGQSRVELWSPGEAVDVARKVQVELYQARSRFKHDPRCLHLFMAVPVGLAMLIGQLLNTFAQVQTYELVQTAEGNLYRPAARLRPSGG